MARRRMRPICRTRLLEYRIISSGVSETNPAPLAARPSRKTRCSSMSNFRHLLTTVQYRLCLRLIRNRFSISSWAITRPSGIRSRNRPRSISTSAATRGFLIIFCDIEPSPHLTESDHALPNPALPSLAEPNLTLPPLPPPTPPTPPPPPPTPAQPCRAPPCPTRPCRTSPCLTMPDRALPCPAEPCPITPNRAAPLPHPAWPDLTSPNRAAPHHASLTVARNRPNGPGCRPPGRHSQTPYLSPARKNNVANVSLGSTSSQTLNDPVARHVSKTGRTRM